ncbi:hypothetical protein KIPB_009081 [Kipferlia bialata]|uniref:Uncharacterized protein n=1 Tax=Kipferlia bialata TaxID=797122 RepID=A0A9K3D140_9EUKA|nr:hypothetical protein KIPB_009081 [Kipferlia bialata]|eukprot:g9081.t1
MPSELVFPDSARDTAATSSLNDCVDVDVEESENSEVTCCLSTHVELKDGSMLETVQLVTPDPTNPDSVTSDHICAALTACIPSLLVIYSGKADSPGPTSKPSVNAAAAGVVIDAVKHVLTAAFPYRESNAQVRFLLDCCALAYVGASGDMSVLGGVMTPALGVRIHSCVAYQWDIDIAFMLGGAVISGLLAASPSHGAQIKAMGFTKRPPSAKGADSFGPEGFGEWTDSAVGHGLSEVTGQVSLPECVEDFCDRAVLFLEHEYGRE